MSNNVNGLTRWAIVGGVTKKNGKVLKIKYRANYLEPKKLRYLYVLNLWYFFPNPFLLGNKNKQIYDIWSKFMILFSKPIFLSRFSKYPYPLAYTWKQNYKDIYMISTYDTFSEPIFLSRFSKYPYPLPHSHYI